MFKYIATISILCFSLELLIANRCDQTMNKIMPKFKLIRRNSRLTEFILSEKILSTVNQCQEFAVFKKALAFNFYSFDISINSTTKVNKDQHNCQVIGCPVTYSIDSLVSDEKFSYYSLYSRHSLPANYSVKCLPRIGLFVTLKMFENYTNAQTMCMKMHGKLAHIVSAERSLGLGKYVGDTPTLVGLSNRNTDRMWRNEFDEPLSCFDYRAWAHGEPSSRGCVTLTMSSINSSSSVSVLFPLWKSVSCSQLLPFICEILPSFY